MSRKSVDEMTEEDLQIEHKQRMKELRQQYAIERDKHSRTPAQRSQLLDIMRDLYKLN